MSDSIVRRLVCAWCQTTTREGAEPTTHGICDTCKVEVEKQYEQLKPRMGEQGNETKQ